MGTAHWRAARVSIKSTVVGSRRQSAASPNMKAQFADLGSTAIALSPADFGKLIADETEKWAKVVKFAGIKAD